MMSNTERLSNLDRTVLVAIRRYFIANKTSHSFHTSHLSKYLVPDVPAGFLPATLLRLANLNLLTQIRVLPNGSYYELTPDGISVVESAAHPEFLNGATAEVPAADRFVSRSDNEAAFSDAEEKLTALVEAVRSTNDLFADGEERLAVIREVEGIRDLLSQVKVRASTISAVITGNGVVRWLWLAGAAGIVGEAAVGALSALARLIGVPV